MHNFDNQIYFIIIIKNNNNCEELTEYLNFNEKFKNNYIEDLSIIEYNFSWKIKENIILQVLNSFN